MAKKNNKRVEQRAERMKKNNRKMELAMTLFLLSLLAEFYLLRIRTMVNGTIRQQVAMASFLPAALYGGLAVLAVGVVMWLLRRRVAWCAKPTLYGSAIGVGAFFAFTTALILLMFPQGATLLCIAVPALMLLGIVYLLYPPEFFLELLALALSLLICALRGELVSGTWGLLVKVGAVVVLAILAALAWLVWRARNGGAVRAFGLSLAVPAKGAGWAVLFASVAVAFLATLAVLVFAGAAYALIWALAAVIFCLAVYHTVKLL